MLLLVAGMVFVTVCVLAALLLVARAGSARTTAPPQEPSSPQGPTSPQGPVDPPSPSAPREPGTRLPASCKITGNVFGNNARVRNGIQKQNVRATYHYYSPHYDTGTLACADIVWKWPNYGQKLLMYPWTAYCLEGSAGWNPQRVCGKCLRVKNRSTGAAIIVRAVDSGGCSGGSANGLDLDPCAFNAIDTNKNGVRDGHMFVDVEEVEC